MIFTIVKIVEKRVPQKWYKLFTEASLISKRIETLHLSDIAILGGRSMQFYSSFFELDTVSEI